MCDNSYNQVNRVALSTITRPYAAAVPFPNSYSSKSILIFSPGLADRRERTASSFFAGCGPALTTVPHVQGYSWNSLYSWGVNFFLILSAIFRITGSGQCPICLWRRITRFLLEVATPNVFASPNSHFLSGMISWYTPPWATPTLTFDRSARRVDSMT